MRAREEKHLKRAPVFTVAGATAAAGSIMPAGKRQEGRAGPCAVANTPTTLSMPAPSPSRACPATTSPGERRRHRCVREVERQHDRGERDDAAIREELSNERAVT